MNTSWRKLATVALISAPFLAACTETPETAFDWGVNDHLPSQQHARVAEAAPAAKLPPRAAPTATVSKGTLAPIGHAPDPNAPAFAWPASGPVISEFGAASNGERNDGINIGVPMDTPIHASASGTVTYSGNELKTYGNLILIRHDTHPVDPKALLVAQNS